jgi:hypothetical protein
MTAALTMPKESLISTRNQRVACGEDFSVVEVKRGDDWPEDARARLDVLIRTGHVVRFDAEGKPDKRSIRFLPRIGVARPMKYQSRRFAEAAEAEPQHVELGGQAVRVLAGRADGDCGDLVVANGRAFALLRGAPDDSAAVEVRSVVKGGKRSGSGRRKKKATTKRRRRKTSGK